MVARSDELNDHSDMDAGSLAISNINSGKQFSGRAYHYFCVSTEYIPQREWPALLKFKEIIMVTLASRFGAATFIRKDCALTNDEMARHVPSIFTCDKHDSRSSRYTYIPTITIFEKLREEGFEPFFACQTRVNKSDRREFTKHMLRLRRRDQIKVAKYRKLFCLTVTMVPAATR